MITTPKQKIKLLYDPKMKGIEGSIVHLIDKLASFYKIKGIILHLYLGSEKKDSEESASLIQSQHNHNEFFLTVCTEYGRKDTIVSFLHEFKHIQQFHQKRAKSFVKKGKIYLSWNNEIYDYKKIINLSLKEWEQLPWEIEAEKVELNYPKFKNIITLKDWYYLKKLNLKI